MIDISPRLGILDLTFDRKDFAVVQADIVLEKLPDMFTSTNILSNRTGLNLGD
jgi:hypothetical protein